MKWPGTLKKIQEKLTPANVIKHLDWRAQDIAGDLSDPRNTRGEKVMAAFQAIRSIPGYFHLRAKFLAPDATEETVTHPENWHFNTNKRGAAIAPEALTEKHPVICFSGDGGIRDSYHLRETIKQTAKLLPEGALSPQELAARIIAYGYNGTEDGADQTRRDADVAALNANPHYCSREAKVFTEKFLLPKVFQEVKQHSDGSLLRNASGDVLVAGKLPPDALASNLRMTLVGDSYGGSFIRQVTNALGKYMLENGYAPQEAHHGIRNIYVHSTCGASPFRRDKPCPTAIDIIDRKDVATLSEMDTAGYFPDKSQSRAKRVDPDNPMVLKIADNQRLYWIDATEHQGASQGNYRFHRVYAGQNLPQDVLNALHCAALSTAPLPDLEDMIAFDVTKHLLEKSGIAPETASPPSGKSYGLDEHGQAITLEDARQRIESSADTQEAIAALRQAVMQDEGMNEAYKAAKKKIRVELIACYGTDDKGGNRLNKSNSIALADDIVYPLSQRFSAEKSASSRVDPADVVSVMAAALAQEQMPG